MNWQQPIPHFYTQLSKAAVVERIAQRKAQLGDRLVILGHHYQQDDVIRFADVVGDSFQLSREAAKLANAEYVIFLRRAFYGGIGGYSHQRGAKGAAAGHGRGLLDGRHGAAR